MSFVKLTVCYDEIEAKMLQDLLESAEIEVFITNANYTSLMQGLHGGAGTGIQVLVEEKDLEQALLILNDNQ